MKIGKEIHSSEYLTVRSLCGYYEEKESLKFLKKNFSLVHLNKSVVM